MTTGSGGEFLGGVDSARTFGTVLLMGTFVHGLTGKDFGGPVTSAEAPPAGGSERFKAAGGSLCHPGPGMLALPSKIQSNAKDEIATATIHSLTTLPLRSDLLLELGW